MVARTNKKDDLSDALTVTNKFKAIKKDIDARKKTGEHIQLEGLVKESIKFLEFIKKEQIHLLEKFPEFKNQNLIKKLKEYNIEE